MPWKECHVMDERLRFVARLLEGEKMAPLCAEFGMSRKTGYKIYDRYKDCGIGAPAVHGTTPTGDQHRPRGPRSPQPRQTSAPASPHRHGHRALAPDRAECVVVRRLQGPVHARQSAVLLSV